MKGTLLERVWAWLHETFPERQIYIRSDGRVQFFTFSPSLQATLAGLTLLAEAARMAESGFLKAERRDMILVSGDVEDLLDRMEAYRPVIVSKWITETRT